ncbi:PREDICTED: radical S-adenosyl methionine domain-containing protein 1, mitochondrial-like isoform X2 [Priapulus caudatus]|uniref:Radical S-adenosyl methionine domain-containing protein 1, mitochondrial-like isoform X2 n=1 Tax=Priapulus caudatus TaxID=37621 RepID=A0ABM1EGR0_PRICU|nr:PREDICTED: radical S-adenosyl methionine domain-containing protein 1, mitochondrial-like isoform X2 [Priapulus caudatus]
MTLEVCDRHLSLYQLTLERGTALFNAVAQKLTTVPDGDTAAEMYCVAVQMLESHGYLRYEVSNFAKPGAESLHNLWCWHGGQYIGVGPGAHGRFAPRAAESARREARIQTLEPIPWMREVERCGHATRKITPLSDLDVLEEMLVTGLRTRTGISNQTWCRLTGGTGLLEMFTAEEVVERIVASDLLHIDSSCMRATTKGLTVVDSIVVELISMLQCYWQNRYTDAETLDAKS